MSLGLECGNVFDPTLTVVFEAIDVWTGATFQQHVKRPAIGELVEKIILHEVNVVPLVAIVLKRIQ